MANVILRLNLGTRSVREKLSFCQAGWNGEMPGKAAEKSALGQSATKANGGSNGRKEREVLVGDAAEAYHPGTEEMRIRAVQSRVQSSPPPSDASGQAVAVFPFFAGFLSSWSEKRRPRRGRRVAAATRIQTRPRLSSLNGGALL
ncbi:hypothetical protein HPP92_022704 [Vanilla planifolia]|uniref:Uncharacterized protein n=1 Tax=Vanilla planifolia TaxID=51239 RepID=A0A835PSM9_VANPL|nr:hypothetical protein HPP92_023000 [Vanilla planifolia]KAG0459576.1 hypothetical protein HPP92_022704 [Vanilla planifolia]